jgi:hypothetical protein
MADFLYIGEYPNGKSVVSFGVVFQLGTPTTLTDDAAINQARNNKYFQELHGVDDEILQPDGNSDTDVAADESNSAGTNRKRGRPKLRS